MWVIVVWLAFVLLHPSFALEKRIFDSSSLSIESIILKAGENRSLSCPGVNEHSLVLALEWFSLTYNVKLVEFMSDSTTVWDNQHRLSLDTKTHGLSFHPALAEDSGDYICLVNSRPKPDGIVRLIVQDVPDPPGRPLIVSFTSRSVNLSWAPSQDTHHSHVTHYIIHISSKKARAMKVARFNETFPQSELRRLEQAERETAYRAAETPEQSQDRCRQPAEYIASQRAS